ncbi:MAG TPA: SAF domain-containing protein [Candidatus Latescibacteria bacterium]|nr:SAF domain-containing protein [Candidatus Latescibacterota bacterium]HJP33120.1 SAF domain-containing protein [Candidatus Latescibacterota bacterium]
MQLFSHLLAERQQAGNPVRTAVIGAGKFGGGLIVQLAQCPGMDAAVVADLDPDRARAVFASCGLETRVVVAESQSAIADTVRAGKLAITSDPMLAARCEVIDVVVDATGVPEAGARHAVTAIEVGRHIVMVNVEADVTVGAALRRRADKAGVVYTLVDGDQPGCTMHMVEWAKTLGFEIVAAGRGTIYYSDDRDGTPDSVQERFGFSDEVMSRRTINTKMYNSFRDGTKAQVEMTALANMAGLPPDVRGMHEPSVDLEDMPRQFSLKEEGGLLSRSGVVELANSIATDGETMLPDPIKMGVFCVIRAEHPFIKEDLAAYGCHVGGDGHNMLLWRPYHLVAVEAPLSIAAAALYGRPTGAPLPEPTADTIAVAKRDLRAGESIDGGGGYTVNGIIEKASVSLQEGLLPLGLSTGARLTADVARGDAVGYADVELPEPDSLLRQLRREQGDEAA